METGANTNQDLLTLEILTYPDPILMKKAEPVAELTDEIKVLADRMVKTMTAAPGAGLAAPQVGTLLRIITVDTACGSEKRPPAPLIMINPEITRTHGEIIDEEGCLSMPGIFADVARPESLTAIYTDQKGERRNIEAEGTLARCIAHETDHLDGVLFWDRLGRFKRDWLRLKFKRLRSV